MPDSTNPLDVPEQTVAQPTPPTTQTYEGTAGSPDDATRTLAAPEAYDPSAVASSRASKMARDRISPGTHPNQAGRYTLLRALAKGGMGLVSVAQDTELDREIALKEIQPKFKLDGPSLHRFLLEARVTGRLEHPGIVPVYGLGTYPDGRPYYAMRFISGDSYQKAIEEFHKSEASLSSPERTLALRQLLRRFIDVCNTIAYAHSRGILHRDIKPANVMLGRFGETLVVDWGLAKEMTPTGGLQTPDMAPSTDTTQFIPVKPTDFQETAEGFTLYGQTMGTPAYMSPEQAAGKWDITGIASDVYSLGAMLYAVLAGAPPYSGPSYEIITKAQRGEYKPIKLVKGNVPAPLDAIIRKAMAFDIQDRYRTALELAADVERWLADEPVSCYRDPFSVRAFRWIRRNRTKAIAAGIVALTSTLALGIGLYFVNRERKEKEKAYILAAESRDEARDALLTLTDDAVGEILAASNRPTPQQVKFLDSLISKYQRFAAREADSPESLLFQAGAYYRIGRLEARVERSDKAIDAYTKALAVLDNPALADSPEALKVRGDVQLYSAILALQRNTPDAEPKFQEAIATLKTLVDRDPKPENRLRLSQAHDRLGVLLLRANRIPEAEPHFQEALTLREQLAKDAPGDPEFKFRVAQSYRQLANVAFLRGQTAEGLRLANDARKIQQDLVETYPTSAVYLALLADLETMLTVHHTPSPSQPKSEKPGPSPAVVHARLAAKAWSRLVGLNPGDSNFQRGQAEANINLARQLQDNNQTRAALEALDVALAVLADIGPDDKDPVATESKRLQAMIGKMSLQNDWTQPRGADPVTTAEALLGKRDTAEVRTYAALARIERAIRALAQRKWPEAKADLDAAWPHVQKAVNDGNNAAIIPYARAMADWMNAAEDFTDVMTVAQKIAELKHSQGESHYDAALFHARVALRLLLSPRAEQTDWQRFAQNQLGHAYQQLTQAVKAGFSDAARLESQPDFWALARKVEFQDLIDDLKEKTTTNRRDN